MSVCTRLLLAICSQGVCTYLLEAVAEAASRGVVIGYDHRHHSKDFALLTAAAFLHRGVKVYLYDVLVHTPLVVGDVLHTL